VRVGLDIANHCLMFVRLSELTMVCIKESSKDLEHQLVRKPWRD